MVLQLGKENMCFEYELYSVWAVVWTTVSISKWINSRFSITSLSSSKALSLALEPHRYFEKFRKKKVSAWENIFVRVKIVLLSKYWSDAAKPCGWIHCIWGGGWRKKLPQSTVPYKTMTSKIGTHCTFSWDAGTKKRSFEQSPLNLLNSLSLLQGYWLGPLQLQMKSAGEETDLQSASTDLPTLLAVVRAVASQRLWWESCVRPEHLVLSS